MNINRDYLIKVDRKSATVEIPNSMSFRITDIKTSNIYCQLVTNRSLSDLVKNYVAVENASDYEILLRVIKPNNEPKEMKFILVEDYEAFFMVDLTEDFKDYIGTYRCELFVDCMVNGELERITTSSFTYKVTASIMNDLDEVIEGDPDYPLVEDMLVRMDEVVAAAEEAIANTDTRVSEAINSANTKIDANITNTNTRINECINNTNAVAEDLETRIGDIETALDEILGGDQ